MGLERLSLGLEDDSLSTRFGKTKVKVTRVEDSIIDERIDSVAFHEACHTHAAFLRGLTVLRATNIPAEDYGGATWVDGYDPVVAAAAEARGCDGTGHDLWSIVQRGYDPLLAVAEASALLAGEDDELNAIATQIQRRGTASGEDMKEATHRVDSDLVKVEIEMSTGRRFTTYTNAREEDVYIDVPVELPTVQQ